MAAPIGIQTNVGSLVAQGNLAVTSRNLQSSISKLSSGLRIQSAADDALGRAQDRGTGAIAHIARP
jgi:flagellin-like hook-associated protein FlgL